MSEELERPWLCGLAWKGLSLLPGGRVRPCCRYWGSWESEKDGQKNLINHSRAVRMRADMLKGHPPKECRRCIEEEKVGFQSKRQRATSLFEGAKPTEALIEASDLVHLEVILGNLCNLRCVTCHPEDSSAWNRDALIAGYEKAAVSKFDPMSLVPYCGSVRRIDLLGGETFLAPELEKVLEVLIRHGNPENMLLTLVTNATIFPRLKVRRLIEKFARVELSCSIDAIGRRNEYIRFPSKWETVKKNLSAFLEWKDRNPRMTLRVANTVSAYSFPGLPELLEWAKEFVTERSAGTTEGYIWLNTLLTPKFQSVHVLPRKVRERIVRDLEALDLGMDHEVKRIGDFALAKDECDLLPKLRDWTLALDQARGLNGREVVPEVFEQESDF